MIVVPFFKNATQIVPNCKTYPKHKTALSIMVFYHHWLKWFGDEDLVAKNTLEKVMIEWGLEKKTLKSAFNLKGEKIKNATIIGLTLTSTVVWDQYSGWTVEHSALIYEAKEMLRSFDI